MSQPQRLPLIPTVFFVTLLGCLGIWQLERLQWKEALLASMDAVRHSAPVNLNTDYLRNFTIADYQPVTVTGRFDYTHELLMPARVHEGEVGYHVLTLLTTDMGQTYLVNRGWVPDNRKDPASRSAGQISGDVTITGIARLPHAPSRWQPANDIAHNLWYGYDLSLMYAVNDVKTQPPQFFIEADATANPGGLPIGGVTQLDIPNNHLQYALTWYGLGALIAVIFAINRLKTNS